MRDIYIHAVAQGYDRTKPSGAIS